MNKAVFLDRDGIINRERGDYTYLPEDFIINPHIPTVIRLLKQHGFLVIIISNQGGIAKGLYKHDNVQQLHEVLQQTLADSGTKVDDFFYCPHHPESTLCLCRKPGSLLIEKAIAMYQIYPKKSFMIGDKPRDAEAAERVGVKGIVVPPNQDILPLCNQIINS